jgi:UDP-glucose 4-epimerase
MTTYLVTGGAGFIGSNIVERLVADGQDVRVLDNFATGKRENLRDVEGRITLVEGDLCDLATVQKAVAGVDYVLHQGAIPSVPRSVNDPIGSNRANVDGTLNLLVAARDAGVKRLVFAASSSAYGNTRKLPKVETIRPDPLSPYAASKLVGEHYCKIFTEVYGFETISLRYFNVFGPRQDPKSQYAAVIPLFITKMLRGEAPTVFGDGEQSRDFSHIDNVIHANLLATQARKTAAGKVYNIACGEHYTLNQLVAILNKLLGTDLKPIYADPRPGDVLHSHADIRRARKLLGYQPLVSFEEGLRRTVEWYRKQ